MADDEDKRSVAADREGSTKPVPDPTVLTTEALVREITALRTVLDQRIDSTERLFESKLDAGVHGGLALKELTASQIADLREVLNERYATQCVSADTPVLCTDLVWRPAGDLLVGDELIGFDAEPSLNHEGGHRSFRRFRKSVVTANEVKRDSLLRVNTTHGSIRCNRDHPFLARFDKRGWLWVRAEDLTPGIMLMSVCDVWGQERSWRGGWLAGFIDGEGCLRFDPANGNRGRFSINQVVGPTADNMVRMFTERFPYIKVSKVDHRHPNWQPLIKLQLDRRIDIMRLLGSVRPQRLLARSDQVWEGFPLRGTERRATVTSVEAVGTGLIASLSTSTKTYVAQGFAVHNTKALDAAFLAQQAAVATSFDASEKAMAAALLAAKEAVEKANTATEKRFDTVNELLGAQNMTMGTLLPRAEADSRTNDLDRRVSEIKTAIDKGFTGTDMRSTVGKEYWGYVVGLVGIVSVILTLVIMIIHH